MSLRVLFRLILLGVVATNSSHTLAAEIDEIRETTKAIEAFQNFFKSRFPELSLEHVDFVETPVRTEADNAQFNKGQHFFWSRRGQLNYSCASCHVDNAGKQLASKIIPAALGLGSQFSKQQTSQDSGSLHEQFQLCNTRTRARPFALQSPEYETLEYYLTAVNHGVKPTH